MAMSALPRAIVTRPAGQAAQWVAGLSAQGIAAQSFPLIDIADGLSPQQRQALHLHASQADVCMWVSANAVSYFFKPNQALAQQNIAGAAINSVVSNVLNSATLRHWATGPGTVAALVQQGVPMAQIDAPDANAAQWDSEALWKRVAGHIQPGKTVLILRGSDVGTPSASRDWLANQVRAAGGAVEFAAVYERRAPQFSAAQLAWAQQAARDGSVWVFSSSQAVTHLPVIEGGWQHARCIATHERIAQAARAKGFAVVCTSRPTMEDVVRSIKSMP
jgi:uroporphyrinogen-III synthase